MSPRPLRIGIASTAGGPSSASAESTTHTITRAGSESISVSPPLRWKAAGGVQKVEGFDVPIAAEVVNLGRTVLITGDDFTANIGLHTIMAGGGQVD